MSDTSFYQLYSLSRTPGYPEENWYQDYSRTSRCPECNHPKPIASPLDVHLKYPPDDVPLNVVTGVGIGFARLEFLEWLGMGEVLENLTLGKVFVEGGGVFLEEFNTFRGKKILPLRGKSDIEQGRACGTCGQPTGFPRGARHLSAGDLTGSSVYESNVAQLIVNQRLYSRVMEREWKKLGRWRTPVLL